jgi:hypothetical protein
MKLSNVVWRQACTIKSRSDEFAQNPEIPEAYSSEISKHSSHIVFQAACSDCCNDSTVHGIIQELKNMQSIIWKFLKQCGDEFVQKIANRLYYACSNFKRLLKRKITQAKEQFQQATHVLAAATSAQPKLYAPAVLSPQIT